MAVSIHMFLVTDDAEGLFLGLLSQSPALSSLSHTADAPWISVLHMIMYVSVSFSAHFPPSPFFPHVHKSVPYTCVSTAAQQIDSSVPSSLSPYMR